jgi:hypothetical protein
VSGPEASWPSPRPVGVGHTTITLREARLRFEFASRYPWLEPGMWEIATELAGRFLAQHSMQPSLGHLLSNRLLPDEHFEFRGGGPRGRSGDGALSRVTDGYVWPGHSGDS